MSEADDPTNPRTQRVLKNGQENSIPFTISPMQHLEAVIIGSTKTLRFCRGEQRSESHPPTQMSDYIPPYIILDSFAEFLLHIIFR